MAIPEALIMRAGLMVLDIGSDMIMDFVNEKKNGGVETITVAELELFAINVKKFKDEEVNKIKARIAESQGSIS